jgi:hypothetical protein
MSGCLHLLLSMYVFKSTVAAGHGGMLVFNTYLLMSGHARGHACGHVGHGGQYTALGQVEGFGVGGVAGVGVGHVLVGGVVGVGVGHVVLEGVVEVVEVVEVVGQVLVDDGAVGTSCSSSS